MYTCMYACMYYARAFVCIGEGGGGWAYKVPIHRIIHSSVYDTKSIPIGDNVGVLG